MSIITVRKQKNKITIAADSQVSWGHNKYVQNDGVNYYPGKMFQINDMTFGIAGTLEEANMMRIFAKNHKPKSAICDDVLQFLVEFETWIKTIRASLQCDNHMILIIEGKIFQCISLDVSEVKTFGAVGSGMFLAIGAMSQGASAIQAVEVAKKYDLYCGGDTINLTIKI